LVESPEFVILDQPEPRFHWLPKGRLSWNQVRTYVQCGACYEYEYILQMPRKVKAAMAVGTAVHQAWAHARRERMAGRIEKLEECQEQAVMGLSIGFQLGDPLDPDPPAEVELQWHGRWTNPTVCERDVLEMVPQSFAAIPTDKATGTSLGYPLLDIESQLRILTVEESIDFTGVFPFPLIGFCDVRLLWEQPGLARDWSMIKDTKTTSRTGEPDVYAAMQLALYGMPDYLRHRTLIPLAIDQHVKTKTMFHTDYWALGVTADHMLRIRELVINAAEGISAGRFPARPGWWCRYPASHGLPSFVSYSGGDE
jgi:hypothetical protein